MGKSDIKKLHKDSLFSHEEIINLLGTGNSGGIRPVMDANGRLKRLVLMTTASEARISQENPYHDRIEGDVLVFTASGKSGDQTLSGVNARLLCQTDSTVPVYAFSNTAHRRKADVRRWKFLGIVQYQRHSKEIQIDSSNIDRVVWVFEFRVSSLLREVAIEDEASCALQVASELAISSEDQHVFRHERSGPSLKLDPFPEFQIEEMRRSLFNLEPREFEEKIKTILETSGFIEVSLTKFSGDGGVDLNAYAGPKLWPLGKLHLQVQAKRWLHSVGRRELAELRGSLAPNACGALISTSYFTRAALFESSLPGRTPITLIDGWDFARRCLETSKQEKLTG